MSNVKGEMHDLIEGVSDVTVLDDFVQYAEHLNYTSADIPKALSKLSPFNIKVLVLRYYYRYNCEIIVDILNPQSKLKSEIVDEWVDNALRLLWYFMGNPLVPGAPQVQASRMPLEAVLSELIAGQGVPQIFTRDLLTELQSYRTAPIKLKFRHIWIGVRRVLLAACAVITVACVSLSILSAAGVDAARDMALRLFGSGGSVLVSSQPAEIQGVCYPTYLPEGFSLEPVSAEETETSCHMVFENQDGEHILFDYAPPGTNLFDSDTSRASEYSINGCPAYAFAEQGGLNCILFTLPNGYDARCISTAASLEELVLVAQRMTIT